MKKESAGDIFEPETPVVPEDWDVLPFERAAQVVSDRGKRVKQGSYLPSGKIPVIDQGQEYIGGYIDDDTVAFEGQLPVVLFGDHTRSVKYVDKRFAVGAEGVKILRAADCYEPKFFYYLLQSLHIPSRGYSRHFQFLRKFHFPVAPRPLQKGIVAEIEKQFSRLDEAVTNLKRVKANLKRYKAAVLKAAVEGKLTEEWRKAYPDIEPASELLKRILAERRPKYEKLGQSKARHVRDPNDRESSTFPNVSGLWPIPETWIWTLLGRAFEVYVGATPSRSRPEYWGGDVPWVSSGEVSFCRIRSTRETITKLGLENCSTEVHPTGTVLLGMIGEGKTRGQVAILDIEACNNQNSAAIRVGETQVLPEYVYSFLESEYETTRTRGSGGNQPALNKDRVKQIPLPLPPLPEQKLIVSELDRRLSNLNNLMAVVDANLIRGQSFRQSVLKQAFSGELLRKPGFCNGQD